MSSIPKTVKCMISNINYNIAVQNTRMIQNYCRNLIAKMNNNEPVTIAVHAQQFLYSGGSKSLQIIQIAECFEKNIFNLRSIPNEISIHLQDGIIIVSPIDRISIFNLTKVFTHQNIRIVTLDILTDIPIMMNEGINFDLNKTFDIENTKLKEMKVYETYPANFKIYCKIPKCIESENFDIAFNESYINKSQLNYKLFNEQNPFDIDRDFWKYAANDLGFIALGFISSLDKFGLNFIVKSAEEKVNFMKIVQTVYGTLTPYIIRRCFIDKKSLDFKTISSEKFAYDIGSTSQFVSLFYDIYSTFIPQNLSLQKIKGNLMQVSQFLQNNKKANKNGKGKNKQEDQQDNQQNQENQQQEEQQQNQEDQQQEEQQDQQNSINEDKHPDPKQLSGLLLKYHKEISFYVSKNKKNRELNDAWNNLSPILYLINLKLSKGDVVYKIIMKSLKNIKDFNHSLNSKKMTPKKSKLMANNVLLILKAIQIFLNFYSNTKYSKCREIEKLLFQLIFNPSNDNSFMTSIYSVYFMHDDFIFSDSPYVNFKSSTGSGKTRCAPFIFSILSIKDQMKRPFFIMTQPSYSIIVDKYKDFKEILNDTVTLVKDKDEMHLLYRIYSKLIEEKKNKDKSIS